MQKTAKDEIRCLPKSKQTKNRKGDTTIYPNLSLYIKLRTKRIRVFIPKHSENCINESKNSFSAELIHPKVIIRISNAKT